MTTGPDKTNKISGGKSIIFACLTIITLLCQAFIPRYEQAGPDRLSGQWQIQAFPEKKVMISEDTLFLENDDSSKSVNVFQSILQFKKGDILYLSADLKCENVQAGEKPWNKARLLFMQYDKTNTHLGGPHQVAAIKDTLDWKKYETFFIINDKTEHARVKVQLSRAIGKFQIKNIRLYPVEQTRAYTWAKKAVLFSWAIFGIFLVGTFFVHCRSRLLLKALLLMSFIMIIIGTSMPQETKLEVTEQVTSRIEKNYKEIGSVLPQDLSKAGHFIFFTVFTGIAALMIGTTSFFIILQNLIMLAGGTELAQFFIDGRGPLFSDFLIDMTGAVSGFFMVAMLRRLSGMKTY